MENQDNMESNLPLVFANGTPSSLETMHLGQLQRFLLFVLKCEQRLPATPKVLSEVQRPNWWPLDIDYDDELLRKNTLKGKWSRNIRKIIENCYKNYNSQFILKFSERLMVWCTEAGSITVKDGESGTRSMINTNTQNLLVTFTPENQDYDKEYREHYESFSSSSLLRGSHNRNLSSMFSRNNSSDPYLPRVGSDIYLCDNCGANYESLKEVMDHEKTCGKELFIDTNFESPCSTSSLASVVSNSGSSSDDSSSGYSSATTLKSNYAVALNRTARLPLNHITEAQQLECKERFINYLGLYATGKIIKKEKIVRPKPLTYAKFFNVDISSPLGKLIIRTGEMGVNDRIDINATELAIPERKGLRSEGADTLVTLDDKEDFPITYLKKAHEKFSRAGKRTPHQYCFNALQRKIRAQILEKGLTHRSVELLRQTRKRIPKVILSRLRFTNNRLLPMNTGFYSSQIVQKKQTPKNVSSAKHQSTKANNIPANAITQPVVSLTPFTKKMIAQPPELPFLILPRISGAEKNSDYLSYASSYPGQMDVTYNNILESNKTSQHEQSDKSAIGENGYELIDLCSDSSETNSIAPIDEVEEAVSDSDAMFEEIDDDLDMIVEEQ